MSKLFSYNTNPNVPIVRGPIFPDYDVNSVYSKKMYMAKQNDDISYWDVMREVFAHDFDTLPKERFKVWASVWNVPFINRTRFMQYNAIALQACMNDQRYLDALKEPMVGCNLQDFQEYLSAFDDFQTTQNRVMCLAHLLICGYKIEDFQNMETILEFGAGIGDLCDIVYKLGFKGKYIIYDFAEVGALQKWYHDSLGHKNVIHTSSIDDLYSGDMVIGTWSLTEMPIELRTQILSKIKETKDWLIAFSNQIFDIDNKKWINDEVLPILNDRSYRFIDIPFMPWHGGAKYLTTKNS